MSIKEGVGYIFFFLALSMLSYVLYGKEAKGENGRMGERVVL